MSNATVAEDRSSFEVGNATLGKDRSRLNCCNTLQSKDRSGMVLAIKSLCESVTGLVVCPGGKPVTGLISSGACVSELVVCPGGCSVMGLVVCPGVAAAGLNVGSLVLGKELPKDGPRSEATLAELASGCARSVPAAGSEFLECSKATINLIFEVYSPLETLLRQKAFCAKKPGASIHLSPNS